MIFSLPHQVPAGALPLDPRGRQRRVVPGRRRPRRGQRRRASWDLDRCGAHHDQQALKYAPCNVDRCGAHRD